jgi:hypothetical protein
MSTLGNVRRRAKTSSCKTWSERFPEEDAFLFFVDVKASRTNMTALEGIDQGTAVEQGAPASVDQHDTPLHLGERCGVDQMMSRRGQWDVQRQEGQLPDTAARF